MNQIALGDLNLISGWLILTGESVVAPFKRAVYEPVFSVADVVSESLLLSLEGAPQELAEALAALEAVAQDLVLHKQTGFPSRPALRFQMQPGGLYFYAPLLSLALAVNPNATETRLIGSLLVSLHFTRQNHYDGDLVELPLSGRFGEDQVGGVTLTNHTDYHASHGNSVRMEAADLATDLPAPLRLELTNTTGAGALRDVYCGVYHHPVCTSEDLFFYFASEFNGGALYTNAAAINAYYCQVNWAGTDWSGLGQWVLLNQTVRDLAGGSFRPALHFFNAHGYQDLQLRLTLQIGDKRLWVGEAADADPGLGYLLFPPIQIPPNRLLNEALPHQLSLVLHAQRETAGDHQFTFDALTLLPLSPGANFMAFYDLPENATLVDDAFAGVQVTRYTPIGSETVAHLRQGPSLTLWPGHHNRLLVLMSDANGQMDPSRTAQLRLFFRPRKRVL